MCGGGGEGEEEEEEEEREREREREIEFITDTVYMGSHNAKLVHTRMYIHVMEQMHSSTPTEVQYSELVNHINTGNHCG